MKLFLTFARSDNAIIIKLISEHVHVYIFTVSGNDIYCKWGNHYKLCGEKGKLA